MDFTLKTYKKLLETFQNSGYKFLTLEEFFKDLYTNLENGQKLLILRHDVDRIPNNSLETAKVEYSLNISASYYFRIVKASFHVEIIKSIVSLNHEIGYHYEDLALADGDYEKAFKQFDINLKKLRSFYPITTMCMHGNPLSKWDNRLIWDKFDYKKFGIICEPYFDIDYNKVFYITDTGRRWDALSINVRDKVDNADHFKCSYKSTSDIIAALKRDDFPKVVIINTHPERWSDSIFLWTKQLIMQNLKNIIKYLINTYNKKKNEKK